MTWDGPCTQKPPAPLLPPAADAVGACTTMAATSRATSGSAARARLIGWTSSRVAQRGQALPVGRRRAAPVGGHDPHVAHQRVVPQLATDQLVQGLAGRRLRLDGAGAGPVDPGRGDRAERVQEEGAGLPDEAARPEPP